jgi:aspartyl-tRNA(Asn)/glutamyl-tRNA(Gln) amidotransferase subunit C
MSLEPATIRRIATLARIHVEDAELAKLAAELNSILGWIEQLNEADVDGVEPLTGAQQMALKMREDVVTDGGYADKVLANAPERAGEFFVVPKVVE